MAQLSDAASQVYRHMAARTQLRLADHERDVTAMRTADQFSQIEQWYPGVMSTMLFRAMLGMSSAEIMQASGFACERS